MSFVGLQMRIDNLLSSGIADAYCFHDDAVLKLCLDSAAEGATRDGRRKDFECEDHAMK